MNIETRLVEEPAELLEVFRFRYRVYVEEMGRVQQYADHLDRTIQEPLDQGAANFGAYEGRVLVGVVRVNWGWQPIASYEDQYRMDMAGPWHPKATTITTKLMVAPSHRRSPVATHLAMAIYAYGYREGSRFNFIDCNPPLDRFFTHLGYRQVIPDFYHPEYGLVRPMVLSIADREHLTSVGSPFVGLLDEFVEDHEAARFGRERLFGNGPNASRTRARQLDKPRQPPALWAQADGGEPR